MRATDAVSARCPDCAKRLGPLADGLTCAGCARRFAAEDGVWDLRPSTLSAPKLAEDRRHETGAIPAWRRLVQKWHWVQWFDERWRPRLVDGGTRTFLEIGGGLCYASALAKAHLPRGCVVATDVSPRYLRRDAVRVGAITGTPADLYAAADAETLPFEDGQFDAIYSQIVLYRLPDPVEALREIRRVLAPGGRWIGVERASPWVALHPDHREIRSRAAQEGTEERPVTYRGWQALLAAAGADVTIAPVPGRRLRGGWARRVANLVRPIYVTLELRR